MKLLAIGLLLFFLGLTMCVIILLNLQSSLNQEPNALQVVRLEYQYKCGKGQKTFDDDNTIKCKSVKRFLAKLNG